MNSPNDTKDESSKQKARVENGKQQILKLLNNDGFIATYAPYVRYGNQIVFPKITDVIYEKRHNLDFEEEAKRVIEHIQLQFDDERIHAELGKINFEKGIMFWLPYPTTIGLPVPYSAVRYDGEKKRILYASFLNAATNFGSEDKPTMYGFSYIFCGVMTEGSSFDRISVYEEVLELINELITAYKIVRHDHTIKNVTAQTMPSLVDYVTFTIGKKIKLSEVRSSSRHLHDLMDVWAKRLLDLPEELNKFREYAVKLPMSKEVQYLLNLMVDSINAFCLGHHESVILDSDRFCELSLRLCAKKLPNLNQHDISEVHTLYSPTNSRKKTLLKLLTTELSLDESMVTSWWTQARDVRNRLHHALDFSVVTREGAQDALRHNLRLISHVLDKSDIAEWDVLLLGQGKDLYEHLFES